MAATARRSGVERFVFHPSDPRPGVHISDHLLGVLPPLGVEPAGRSARLPVRSEWLDVGRDALAARGVTSNYAVLHPGSGGRAKRWPVARFAELASRLSEPVVWLLGPAERDDGQARDVGEGVGTILDRLTLRELAGVLAACRLYVGNDSGVSHLAAALGAPTVAVFGATDPSVWAPRGERVTIASGWGRGGLGAVSVDEVEGATRRSRSS
jgi:ADP-heptose:LPS heptosyltransferase